MTESITALGSLIKNATTSKLFVLTMPLLALIAIMGYSQIVIGSHLEKLRDIHAEQARLSQEFLEWVRQDEESDTKLLKTIADWIDRN